MDTRSRSNPRRRRTSGRPLRLTAILLAGITCLSLGGCVVPENDSEWRWRQWNPDYRPPFEPEY
ncbi:MAG: hypothetical protein KDM81_18170 [Verrucomicrobiae bacterium]|nr:hypothetical protein [Verrucomicrobiae bacterium]MCP5517787.1 hypothetical protein [Verrucomicrobiales bacterium]MCP5526879.1 hypothetical protein [Verrucomicrobiales bacterium]